MTEAERSSLIKDTEARLPGTGKVRRVAAEDLVGASARLAENRDVAADRHGWIGAGTVDDYLDQLVPLPDGGAVQCGIRFYGLDPDRPFVDLVGVTEPVDDWQAAAQAGLAAYAAIGPSQARLIAAGTTPPVASGFDVSVDQWIVSASLADLAEPGAAGLEAADVDEAMAFVEARYAAFGEARPELAKDVSPAERVQLEACRDCGRLDWWTIDGRRAGLIGVEPDAQLGLDGFCVIEELVAAEFLGQRTAARAQRAIAAALIADGHDGRRALHGTIDRANAASLRAAEAAGRIRVGAYWFLQPA